MPRRRHALLNAVSDSPCAISVSRQRRGKERKGYQGGGSFGLGEVEESLEGGGLEADASRALIEHEEAFALLPPWEHAQHYFHGALACDSLTGGFSKESGTQIHDYRGRVGVTRIGKAPL